jgi:long-chain fatty acid transport protein
MYFNIFILIIGLILHTASAFAANGAFLIGYGAKSIGVGGAAVAFPQDRMIGAVNPAGFALVPEGYDAGVRVMTFIRNASLDCRGIGACDTVVKDRSARDLFIVPNFGWNRNLSDKLTLGLSVYANGGINSSYGRGFYDETAARIFGGRPGDPGFPDAVKFGIDFSQLLVAPSLAWRVTPSNVIGVSPVIAIQRFSVRGLLSFGAISSDASSVSERGTDYEPGIGVRVGWIGDIRPGLRFGAQYTSRIWVAKTTKYNGFLAGNGDLDAPPQWTIGLAWDASEKLTFAFDFQRILWDSVDSISNPGPTASELAGIITPQRMLGGSDGIGFGWRDQSVFKLGLRYRPTERLTLRGGVNHASSQIPNRETLVNILAPATMNKNVTIGGSWNFGSLGELSATYKRTFKKTNHDRSTAFFGTAARGSIYMNMIDVNWSKDY